MHWSEEFEEPVLVGEGGHSKVYRLVPKKEGPVIALKLITHQGIWERERELLKQADHPLFPRYIDADWEENAGYILMEYVWGMNLAEVLDRRKGFAQMDAMRMAIEIADGLAWLQSQDGTILFRDLKAENLILTPDGSLKLVDFGSACELKDAGDALTGTPGYAPQEQLTGAGELSKSCDVYAFGHLFHYLLTGQNPILYPGQEPESLQCFDPALSFCLDLLIRDCTCENGQERLPDMYCVLQRLMEIATATSWQYRKMEKAARKKLESASSKGSRIYQKDVCP